MTDKCKGWPDGEHCWHPSEEGEYCCGIECDHALKSLKVASEVPTSRILDEFGFPLPAEEMAKFNLVSSKDVNRVIMTAEDYELTKRFLKDAQDKTLSRNIHRVLGDLLGRLP